MAYYCTANSLLYLLTRNSKFELRDTQRVAASFALGFERLLRRRAGLFD